MKTSVLLLLCLAVGILCLAQPATIQSFASTSFEVAGFSDSAFCKGQQMVKVKGSRFVAVPSDEEYDSTSVALGSQPCVISWLSDTLIETSFPNVFPNDTSLLLLVTKHSHIGSVIIPSVTAIPVRLVGDYVTITYPPDPWCVGSTNPIPEIEMGGGSVLGIFTAHPNGSFSVLPSGEVPLHSGAVGLQSWDYMGGHVECPHEEMFSRTILARTSALVLFDGSSLVEWCQSDPPVFPNIAYPAGGLFYADSGLVLADDSLGTIVPASSIAGTHQLWYVPPFACSDTATATVTILPAPDADIQLSGEFACLGVPTRLFADAQGALNYRWFLEDSEVGGNDNFLELDNPSDGDTISLIVENAFLCADTATIEIAVHIRPTILLVSTPKVVLEGEVPVYSVLSDRDSSILGWSFEVMAGGSGTRIPLTSGSMMALSTGIPEEADPRAGLPSYRSQASDRFRFVAYAYADGCTGEADTVYTEVVKGGSPIFIPEVMTPDGNGMNDVWEIRWTGDVRPDDYHIELFNRAGGRVLEMSPIHSSFDGGNLPDGVYWWTLRDRAGRHLDRGGLTIRRK